jgi:hypothetical protein
MTATCSAQNCPAPATWATARTTTTSADKADNQHHALWCNDHGPSSTHNR